MDMDEMYRGIVDDECVVRQIVTKVKETESEFIFETICSWLEEKKQIVVSKQELIDAIRFQRKFVRCKDCKYATQHWCESVFGKALYGCSHVSQIGRGAQAHPEDWFCADGERKVNGAQM